VLERIDHLSEMDCLKFKADRWRDLAEHCNVEAELERCNREAEQADVRGIGLADEVKWADPVRLGVIMNYGVLIYEHLNDVTRAIELAADAHTGLDQLTVESDQILLLMQTSLVTWETAFFDGS
jgi:hypothetical protein